MSQIGISIMSNTCCQDHGQDGTLFHHNGNIYIVTMDSKHDRNNNQRQQTGNKTIPTRNSSGWIRSVLILYNYWLAITSLRTINMCKPPVFRVWANQAGTTSSSHNMHQPNEHNHQENKQECPSKTRLKTRKKRSENNLARECTTGKITKITEKTRNQNLRKEIIESVYII